MNIKNLFIRAIAGIVYIAVVLLGIFGGIYAFTAVFGLFLIVALLEYYRIVELDNQIKIRKILNILAGVAIFSSSFFAPVFTLSIVVLYFLIQSTETVFTKRTNNLSSTIHAVFGQFYLTLPFFLLSMIYIGDGKINEKLILAIFVFIWINDTAAYLVGSLFGKHKLYEKISPKKTIEGFVGGVVLATSAAFVFSKLIPEFSLYFWIGFGLITAITGTIGDLFESSIKRTYNIKDSGHLIPGHGGILDRIDSFLFAVPAIFIYMYLISL